MKKFIVIILMVMLVFVSGCSKKTYTEISYKEYQSMQEKGKTFPLVIGSATCSACVSYKTVMDQFISKYQVEVMYIDVNELSEEEYNALKLQITFDGTPTTVFFEDGKLTSFYNRIDGAANMAAVTDVFRTNNYIK